MKRSTDTRWSPAEIQQNQKEHYADMAEHPPDRKASEKFHRPAYQARKYRIGDDTDGDNDEGKTGSVQK